MRECVYSINHVILNVKHQHRDAGYTVYATSGMGLGLGCLGPEFNGCVHVYESLQITSHFFSLPVFYLHHLKHEHILPLI